MGRVIVSDTSVEKILSRLRRSQAISDDLSSPKDTEPSLFESAANIIEHLSATTESKGISIEEGEKLVKEWEKEGEFLASDNDGSSSTYHECAEQLTAALNKSKEGGE